MVLMYVGLPVEKMDKNTGSFILVTLDLISTQIQVLLLGLKLGGKGLSGRSSHSRVLPHPPHPPIFQ